MPPFDLHCHSTHSDGLLTPPELVARAAERGVETLALTDHDSKQREALLENFTELGGGAIEVVTGRHTREQYAFWGSCARRFGLSASVGSDFHGPLDRRHDFGGLDELPGGCTPIWNTW